MTHSAEKLPKKALLVLGCPEVPVQQALALHLSHILMKQGFAVHASGNPAVLNLLKVSDPENSEKEKMNIR
ncbi:DUF1890 family protein [Methanoregula sp.]|uniref:DUF1890 family protein n=1 Tax=Methanoregula sp. TaxID=2052170 RepID=UPI003C7351D7